MYVKNFIAINYAVHGHLLYFHNFDWETKYFEIHDFYTVNFADFKKSRTGAQHVYFLV